MDSMKVTQHRLQERMTSGGAFRDALSALQPSLPGFVPVHAEAMKRDPVGTKAELQEIEDASARTRHDIADATSLTPIGLAVRGYRHLTSH